MKFSLELDVTAILSQLQVSIQVYLILSEESL
jgi:hypothetical protein